MSVVKGVKMGSYFAICVRPQNAMGQARELHHISQALDLLRQGELDSLGDVLAGRFMSVHQSVLDGTWTTARHLELMPLEDGTAAGPEVVLEAKRHARLAAKLASGDAWTWSSGSKGKGGRGRNSNWHEGGGDSKGKGEERQQRKRKGEELEFQREGRGLQDQGENSRKIGRCDARRDHSLAMAVENSSAEANVTVQLSVACLKEAMGACTSFDQLGCMLAWLAVADAAHFRSDIILQEFGSLWLRDVAKTKSARKQRKGVTFPLREGELSDLVQIFATKALAQMADAAFADTWSCKAWVYTMMCALNHLAGEKARLGPGRWSVSERRVVLSLESAVQRRNGRSVAHPTSEMEWQKDVGSRQVGYSGEEQSVCHVLTWEQVEPALPLQIMGDASTL